MPRAPDWLDDGARNGVLLLPFLVTAGIVGFAWGAYGNSDFQAVPTGDLGRLIKQAGISGPDAPAAAVWEYTGHLIWNALAGVYVVLMIATIIIGIWIVHRLATWNPRCGLLRRWWWPVILLTGFLIVTWFVMRNVAYGVISGSLLTPTVFAQAPDLPARQQFFSKGGQIIAIFFAALASLILPSSECRREACLRERSAFLGLVLGMGAALLVTDVIREDALLRWAMAFIDPSNKVTTVTIQNLTAAIVATRGIFGTVLLAAIYLPAAFILRDQAWQAVPANITTRAEAKQWLQDEDLIPPSAFLQFRPIVAVLLPLLTGVLSGPAGEVVKNLTHP
jgi:hypothetical protein